MSQLSLFDEEILPPAPKNGHVTNVASVPQRSPFRYPGGKTWLVPTARKWFTQANEQSELIEPFAGGGIISLTAVAEHYFNHATMVEIDDDMAAAWQTMLSKEDFPWLIDRIGNFVVTAEDINESCIRASLGIKERGFSTIVRNRTNHGGILAKGSGMIKQEKADEGFHLVGIPRH